MRGDTKSTVLDRLAIALLSALFGLATSAIIWFSAALATKNPTFRVAPFVFASSSFGIAGFFMGTSFAEVLGVWFQGLWAAVNAWAVNPYTDLGPKPFRPFWATLFLVGVVAVTVWLSFS